jgi:hypothetical protein
MASNGFSVIFEIVESFDEIDDERSDFSIEVVVFFNSISVFQNSNTMTTGS